MTKKFLGLMFVALLCVGIAGAATLTETCAPTTNSANNVGGLTPFSTVAGYATCAGFSMPASNTLISIQLYITNSFSGAFSDGNQINTILYSYTISGFGTLTTAASTLQGTVNSGLDLFSPNSSPCTPNQDSIGFEQATLYCIQTPGQVATSPTAVTSVVISGISSWVSGSAGFNTGGNSSFTVLAKFTYGDLSAPEPASMLLVGGGLIGLALASRKRFRA